MVTAWQYVAGAGLVGALCPLHGHVAVAGDGHGRGARVDVCVPGGSVHVRPPAGGPATVRPPSVPSVVPPAVRPPVRVTLPGAGPTAHHPGRAPGLPAAEGPRAAAPVPGLPDGPPAAGAEPVPAAAPSAAPAGPVPPVAPAAAPAPGRARTATEFTSAFRMRPYHPAASERRGPDGLSAMMLMVVVGTPAVLAAAALRPRSKGRG
ncbi:hypothetical protein [Streptomyces sp. H27-H5]|uniref:hypothetical protein n=1 Tax=Streptomyces sp. H27-H5 TaxID=2996460 RepID=UPI002270EB16|nr:hypothetical protein [Streptomyces sp. H27-H5]MCY0961435.1 hypothetical protein [Streptomyces sp. H27-H5]